jgi:hypothetical protein
VTGLLLVLVLVGLPLVGLFADLCRHDLQRSRALAEAALRRALEDPRTDPRDTSGAGTE